METPKLARVFWSIGFASILSNVPSPVGILNLVSGSIASNHILPKAIAAEVRYWEYDPYTNQLQITSEEAPQYFILADPPRIAIDIPNSNFGQNPIQENYPGLVRTIRVSEFKPGQTRIVMDLDPSVTPNPGQVQLEPLGQGNRWVLRLQLRVSQTLPSLEPTETLPQLPPMNQIPSQPSTAIVPPLPTATIPINSEIGLPTAQVTPLAGDLLEDPQVTVQVPPLQEITSTTELTDVELAEQTEIFVPPPPPPEWQVGPEIAPPPLSTAESVESVTSGSENAIESVPETNTITRSPDPVIPANQNAEAPVERENSSSLPPYSEWQELSPGESAPEIVPVATATDSASVIIFGESLPKPANQVATQPDLVTAVNSTNLPDDTTSQSEPTEAEILDSDILLAAGTIVILRYPGTEGFTLKSGSSRREVLVVDVAVYDRDGEVIAPVGTPVIGSFETDRSGSRFVVESILLDGQMVPIVAESENIAGSGGGGILSWSTLGAVGGAALGSLAGGPLLGGAAAGVAANLLSSDKQGAIEPGQAIPVRAIEHWRFPQP